jgi:hypothetical protein
MGREPVAKQRTLGLRNRKTLLIVDDSVPKRTDVADLFFRCEVIEPRRRNRKSVCHGTKDSSCC